MPTTAGVYGFGEGEWTSACGRCEKFGEGEDARVAGVYDMRGEWTSACGRCEKFGEGEVNLI